MVQTADLPLGFGRAERPSFFSSYLAFSATSAQNEDVFCPVAAVNFRGSRSYRARRSASQPPRGKKQQEERRARKLRASHHAAGEDHLHPAR
jgi:hypothetical protein